MSRVHDRSVSIHDVEYWRKWIKDRGGNKRGYVQTYGSKDDPDHYGDGGEAIYEADVKYLRWLEEELKK